MANGYMGKILKIDFDAAAGQQISTLNTLDYSDDWGGAHGMGSKVFWDLAVAPGDWDLMDGFNSRNVVTFMAGPLNGTLTPCAAGRTEIQGVAVQKWPTEWFSRSGFGGRFAAQLKAAGWDGIAIQGIASSPVWIKIVNSDVTLEDASAAGDNLWGMNNYDAQQEMWRLTSGSARFGDWVRLPGGEHTTQRPAVSSVGPAGELKSRSGSMVHDGGNGGGQGGYGGVLGGKNVKGISVLGTQSVEIADPEALVDARAEIRKSFSFNVDSPLRDLPVTWWALNPGRGPSSYQDGPFRASGCVACSAPCRRQHQSAITNDSQCVDASFSAMGAGISTRELMETTDWVQKLGINARDCLRTGMNYQKDLYALGVLGKGKAIDTSPIDFDLQGTPGWPEHYLKNMAYRGEGFGDELSEGIMRAAATWGRIDNVAGQAGNGDLDSDDFIFRFPHWGDETHWTLPGIEWAYGGLIGDRDINCHIFTKNFACVLGAPGLMESMPASAWVDKLATMMGDTYNGDPYMFNYSDDADTGIYSMHKAKQIAWDRRYDSFWMQSAQLCCWVWPNLANPNNPDFDGWSTKYEPIFFNAVTGRNITFDDGIKIGGRIWNMDRAIHMLQGRTRDQETHEGYMFKQPQGSGSIAMPYYKDGTWSYEVFGDTIPGMLITREGEEEWKTNLYEHEGWNTTTGSPTRATLEGLGLGYVADKLESENVLG